MERQHRRQYWVIALLLAILIAFPRLLVDSHNPLAYQQSEAERHQLLDPSGEFDHDHAHRHGDDAEQRAYHLHGHDPADHLHETACPPPMAVLHLSSVAPAPPGYRYVCQLYRPQPPRRPPKAGHYS